MKQLLVNLARKIVHFVYFNIPRPLPNAIDKVNEIAAQDSAEFIHNHLNSALLFDDNKSAWKQAISSIPTEGLILEFGVHKAASLTFFAKYLSKAGDGRKIYGFDSFTGLSEEWSGTNKGKGYFDLGGNLPEVPENAKLVAGWIDDTLPKFLEEHEGKIAFIHIDTDTYEPAATILRLCKSRLVPGSIILFDELVGYPNWRNHEFKALYETLGESEFTFTGFSWRQAIIKIGEGFGKLGAQ